MLLFFTLFYERITLNYQVKFLYMINSDLSIIILRFSYIKIKQAYNERNR
jgi:hypothetical protein